MILRPQPLSLSVGPGYCLAEIGERQIFLRKPMASEAAELLRWTFDTENVSQAEIKQRLEDCEEGDFPTQMAILRDSNQYIEAMRGRLIGKCWSDVTHELESIHKDFPTPEAFGLAVYAELFEDGWTVDEIDALHSAVLELLMKLGQQRYNATKVTHILNFGEAPKVTKPLCTATSESDTSETLGA